MKASQKCGAFFCIFFTSFRYKVINTQKQNDQKAINYAATEKGQQFNRLQGFSKRFLGSPFRTQAN